MRSGRHDGLAYALLEPAVRPADAALQAEAVRFLLARCGAAG